MLLQALLVVFVMIQSRNNNRNKSAFFLTWTSHITFINDFSIICSTASTRMLYSG